MSSFPPDFHQAAPHLGNSYEEDTFLQAILKRIVPNQEVRNNIQNDLQRFGTRCVTDLLHKSNEMERTPPKLISFDSQGQRIDTIWTCREWQEMHDIAAEEGIVAIGYERTLRQYSRIHQMMKLYMYAPSAGLYNCPLAMTDGAARLCEVLLAQSSTTDSIKTTLKDAYSHLTTRNPSHFWTSGQWMTERGGGSDVGDGTRTVARLQPDGTYRLYGYKWFTSATDADMTITLARIEDANGATRPHSSGLSCFFLKVRNSDGQLNNIKIGRLKDKLGTKQLPTAELELCGAVATLISPPGRGIAFIATLINVTRVYNAISACGGMRRMLALERDYAHRRVVFGQPLSNNPTHLETLATQEIAYRASMLLTMDVVERMGRVECNVGSKEDELLLRLLTPLAKLYTGKLAVSISTEGVESFGGAGYVEDTQLPRMLRDAQVLPIWEGTTNVLAHDVLRVFRGQPAALKVLVQTVTMRVQRMNKEWNKNMNNNNDTIKLLVQQIDSSITKACKDVESFALTTLGNKSAENASILAGHARYLAFALARIYVASMFIEHALFSGVAVDWHAAHRYIMDGAAENSGTLVPVALTAIDSKRLEVSRQLALDIEPVTGKPRGCGDVQANGMKRSKL